MSHVLIRSLSLADRLQTLFDCVPYPTDFETMHASKPHAAYYREIATLIRCAPENCVMVGNEIANDILPARRVGMKTFFVANDGNAPPDVPADWTGALKEFGTLIKKGI